jgi:hypothetical protein
MIVDVDLTFRQLRVICRSLRIPSGGDVSKKDMVIAFNKYVKNGAPLKIMSVPEMRSMASAAGLTVGRQSRDRRTLTKKLAGSKLISSASLKISDFCCGLGGVSIGAYQAGCSIVNAYDNDELTAKAYSKNVPVPATVTDITKHIGNVKDADLFWGSTPCPPFSAMGQKLGFSDSRGKVTKSFVQLVAQKKPKACVLENSPFIEHVRGGRDWKWIKRTLRNAGYIGFMNFWMWFVFISIIFNNAQYADPWSVLLSMAFRKNH